MTASPMTEGWLALLQGAVARAGSIKDVAADLGYSRTAISLVLSGKYGGSTDLIARTVLERYAPDNRWGCPHLGVEIAADDCRAHAARPMPQSDPLALRHWGACQGCPLNPAPHRRGPESQKPGKPEIQKEMNDAR